MTKQWIRRETTAMTIADAPHPLTRTGTNVRLEHVAVSPDPDHHTSDATAPHVPSASAGSRCPATPRVVSTGRGTVANHPHPDHPPCPPLLLCPRCSHRRDHPLLHHRHGTTDTPHGDAPTVTYEGNTAAITTTAVITTTGATATASESHTHLRHLCPVPLPLTTVSSAKSGEVSTLILITCCPQ